jgi:hypothetical protein
MLPEEEPTETANHPLQFTIRPSALIRDGANQEFMQKPKKIVIIGGCGHGDNGYPGYLFVDSLQWLRLCRRHSSEIGFQLVSRAAEFVIYVPLAVVVVHRSEPLAFCSRP